MDLNGNGKRDPGEPHIHRPPPKPPPPLHHLAAAEAEAEEAMFLVIICSGLSLKKDF
jgi:hypothetical protein